MSYRDIIEQKKREKEDNSFPAINDNKPEESFNSDYFGIENLRNLPACLDLRFADGNCEAIPYSLITGIKLNPEIGIVIKTTICLILISGRNLSQLYHYLTMYKVRYIQANQGFNVMNGNLIVLDIKIEEI